MSSPKYESGDTVVCRSDYGVEGLVTPGRVYRVAKMPGYMSLASALGIGISDGGMVTVTCDDGVTRAVNKLRFVPSTEAVSQRGKLTLVRRRASSLEEG